MVFFFLATFLRSMTRDSQQQLPFKLFEEVLDEDGELVVGPAHGGQQGVLHFIPEGVGLTPRGQDRGLPDPGIPGHRRQDVGTHRTHEHICARKKNRAVSVSCLMMSE